MEPHCMSYSLFSRHTLASIKIRFLGETLHLGCTLGLEICVGNYWLELRARRLRSAPSSPAWAFTFPWVEEKEFPSHTVLLIS